ncbi:hypothetical protein BW730_15170 [Tessaracoccus aquimaris]|uniref:Uncharacterized protein n=1 Tax=Tessaracoccus aquimaris TaxID=1332264 RepID=A0A1Q2CR94_9ACTN|nr:hypothetical protein BW730_15170 [Tessaracoccus aquimaris]
MRPSSSASCAADGDAHDPVKVVVAGVDAARAKGRHIIETGSPGHAERAAGRETKGEDIHG